MSLLDFFENLNTYIREGEFNEALQLIDKLVEGKDLDQRSIVELSIQKIGILLMKGKYKEGLALIDELKKICQEKNYKLLELELAIFHVSYMYELGKLEEILKEIYFVEEMANKITGLSEREKLLIKIKLILNRAQYFQIKGNKEQTKSNLGEVFELFKKIDDKKGVAIAKNQLAFLNRETNNHDTAIKLYNEALKIHDEIGDLYGKLKTLKDLGTIYLYKGERSKASNYYLQSFEIARKIGNKDYQGRLYNNLGIICDLEGDLREAIEYYEKSLEFMEEYDNKEIIAKTLNNIGSVYIKMGNLEEAEKNIEESLEIFQEIGNVQNIFNSFNHLGRIYVLKGNYNEALINFQMSLNMMDKIESHGFNSFTLYNYIKTSILNNDLTNAKEKLAILERIDQDASEPMVHIRTLAAKALLLKRSARSRDRVKAEELFEEIIANDKTTDELKNDAMLNLCDIKLMELKETKDSGLLEEVKDLANQVLTNAKNQKSMLLYAETYWLLSQIALIELDFDTARQLLTQAQLIAEEWEIRNLALKIALEHDKLLERLDLWEKLSERNADLTERMELAEIEDYFLKIIRDRKFDSAIIPEEPIMFMLMKKSGAPIYSKQFLDQTKLDDSLVSGFLAAINAFAKETFPTSGPIERIRHNDYTIILQTINQYIICYIFYGQSYNALQRLIRIIDRIKKEKLLWNELVHLSESTTRINELSEKILDKIIDEVLV